MELLSAPCLHARPKFVGQISIVPKKMELPSPCLHARPKFVRQKIVYYVSKFLDNMKFRKVDAVMRYMYAGGAAANPFVIQHNDLNMRLSMRNTPDLFLQVLDRSLN